MPGTSDLIRTAVAGRVYDLEQPRMAGMPIHPAHRPGYTYHLHRRHRDGYLPEKFGPRSGASGLLFMMEHTGPTSTPCPTRPRTSGSTEASR